ncbi:MAG: hypothetical protein DMG28_09105 [Acidobacteria bacterium]|nr:MAG: hypothetical protein DMG28_09105 [Acidobacteriota bacterium]
MGAKRENIETPLQASGAQRGEELVLIGELLVVAAVVWQKHVHDGAGDEDDDGRQQDREPKCGERNHAKPPPAARANAGISHARGYACPELRSRGRTMR